MGNPKIEFTIKYIILSVSFCISLSTHLHGFQWKTKCFKVKLFSNLVFGDDFAFVWARWLSYDFVSISREIWHLPPWWRTRGKLLRGWSRNMEYGFLLIQSAEWIRRSLILRIIYSKHSRTKNFWCCYRMMSIPS